MRQLTCVLINIQSISNNNKKQKKKIVAVITIAVMKTIVTIEVIIKLMG